MNRTIVILLLLSLLFIAGCFGNAQSVNLMDQTSITADVPDRWFVAPEVWAWPWENWKVQQGRITVVDEPINVKKPMNIQHLTAQVNTNAARALMSASIKLEGLYLKFAKKGIAASGSAGFAYGIRVDDPIDDYRSRILRGKGVYAGFNSLGQLFIGDKRSDEVKALAMAIANGQSIRLSLEMVPVTDKYMLFLVAYDEQTGEMLAQLGRSNVAPDTLIGNVALAINMPRAITNAAADTRWSFDNWRLTGDKFTVKPEQAFGPIYWSQYTLSNNIMKMTAQLAPISPDDNQTVLLQVKKSFNRWETIAKSTILPDSWTAPFRVENWDPAKEVDYRIVYTQNYTNGQTEDFYWSGTIRKDPVNKQIIDAAIFCCFTDFLFPNKLIADNVKAQDPDLLLFTGDQIYEGNTGVGVLRKGDHDRMMVNYMHKLALWGWSFRDIMKNRPTVTMPDDHDVYHGNVWGDAGRKITLEEWSSKSGYKNSAVVGNKGGYVQPIEFVKAVEATQVSHLPDPACTKTFKQGLTGYFTSMNYGKVGFAILEDRKFKSAPMSEGYFKHSGPRPDHIPLVGETLSANLPDRKLLGDDQIAFLRKWSLNWKDQSMKFAVSQTGYAGTATHHGGYDNYLAADMDCGGWPQVGRDKAVDALRRGAVVLLAGDQHLPVVYRNGIEAPGDGNICFITPAGATGYQRWWRPEDIKKLPISGGRHNDLPDTGLYYDGFNNIVDILAVGNPPASTAGATCLEDRGHKVSAGWGIASFDKSTGKITMNAWPVKPGQNAMDPAKSVQFAGWPITISQHDNFGISVAQLPTVTLEGKLPETMPIVRVLDSSANIVSSARMYDGSFIPKVYADGSYTVQILSPADDQRVIKEFNNLKPGDKAALKFKL
ncbi:MAG: alkaline phosphatase D family protein [Phycisphaerae bacterium]|nr:alkaline phosphatase D family protein [Phycisphaerae bacterium]